MYTWFPLCMSSFLKQFIWTSQVISPLDFPRFWIFLIAYSWYSSSCIYVLYIPHKLASESRGLIRVSFNLSISIICAFISRHRMSGFAFYFILLYFSCCLCSMHMHLIIGSKWWYSIYMQLISLKKFIDTSFIYYLYNNMYCIYTYCTYFYSSCR